MRTFNSYSLNNFQRDNTNIINCSYHPVHYTSPYDLFVPLKPFTISWTSGNHQSVLLCENFFKNCYGLLFELLLVLRVLHVKEGNGNSLQYSCLENPMVRGAWWAAVHRVAQSRRWLKWLSMHAYIGERNGNPLQYSYLENPRDRGAGWAAIYGVSQSQTRLKRLSSRSSM